METTIVSWGLYNGVVYIWTAYTFRFLPEQVIRDRAIWGLYEDYSVIPC